MSAKIAKIWLESYEDNNPAIRVDLTNDRHYRIEISTPHSHDEVGKAFIEMGILIRDDKFGEARKI